MPIIIAVVGLHHSGKTTTIEYLISHLTKEGYSIGTIKHIHHEFSIDKEGTNTWRHMHAGSKITVAVAPHETTIIKKTKSAPNNIDKIICLLKDEKLDFIFIEGFHELIVKRGNIPTIVSAKDPKDLKGMLEKVAPPILAITGLVTKQKTQDKKLDSLMIDLPQDGPRLLEIVKHQLNQN